MLKLQNMVKVWHTIHETSSEDYVYYLNFSFFKKIIWLACCRMQRMPIASFSFVWRENEGWAWIERIRFFHVLKEFVKKKMSVGSLFYRNSYSF